MSEPTPRRRFLSWLGASSVLAASTSFVSSVDAQAAKPVDDKWDMSWTDRLTGKFKAVFDSPEVSEGDSVLRACIWRDQHKAVFGTARNDANAVLVLRHAAIDMVMNDAYWNRFDIGKELKLKDEKTKKWTKVNPFRAAAADATGPFKEYNLTDFMASGGIVLACNLAFRSNVARYETADKLTAEAAAKVAKENLIPGIILQPSGIFATLRAQEVGCNYVLAS